MDDTQHQTHTVATLGEVTPKPCAAFLAAGALVTLVALGVVALGLSMYLGAPGRVGVLLAGVLMSVTGLALLLVGVLRAAAALDHLVRTR